MSLADSRWFRVEDGACKDGEPYPPDWEDEWTRSSFMADKARDIWGGPLLAVSWYRSPGYNARLIATGHHNVASSSNHMRGIAVDLKPTGIYARSFADPVLAFHQKLLEAYGNGEFEEIGGLGLYQPDEWVHIDLDKAADGHLRRWSTRG
jgi:uncharacterized protein YcbK (DUF882 family)